MIKNLTRKLHDHGKRLTKLPSIIMSTESDLKNNRPLLLNSIPKSGTHLLYQILEIFPFIDDKGEFIANIPSRPYRFRTQKDINRRIGYITPGELIRSHLFYSDASKENLSRKHVIKYFIYRDPRDIAISEAMYLSEMNKWHEMSTYFKGLDVEERITLAIKGLESKKEYPSIRERVSWYKGWFIDDKTLKVKFEDLVDNEKKVQLIHDIVHHYQNSKKIDFDAKEVEKQALENIVPEKSHTFRSGNKKNWQDKFTSEHKTLFKDIAGDLLIDLGYETNLDW